MEYTLKWKVSKEEEGQSLLSFLKIKTQTDLSNRALKKAVESGVCRLNHRVETFASKKIRKDDLVELCDFCLKEEDKKAIFKVLYEDSYFIIINKPAGVLCTDNEIQKFFKNAILVHRLDRETSGALILAKSLKVKEMMKELFSQKLVKKTYIAVVDGEITEKVKEIKSSVSLNKNSFGKVLWHSQKEGSFAHTIFERIKKKNGYSVLRCLPITGRTHQIRVHLFEWGHPILGDYKYGRNYTYSQFVPRLLLHSLMVEFEHPVTHALIKVLAPLPGEFKHFVGKNEVPDR
jgi:RluA family pseudouridine synthase